MLREIVRRINDWTIIRRVKDWFFHAKEGINSSTRENRIWITLYTILSSMLLAGQTLLQYNYQPLTSPLSIFTIVISIVISFLSICLSVWFYRCLSLPPLFFPLALVFQTLILTELLPFTIKDILMGPGLTWIIAVIIAIVFTFIGRFPSFNQDLLPRISILQSKVLNLFAAVIILSTGLSFSIFYTRP